MSWRVMMEAFVGKPYDSEQEAEEAKQRAIDVWNKSQGQLTHPQNKGWPKFYVMEVGDDVSSN